MSEIQELISKLIEFRDKRDWAQFHDSKNLALAISIEAAELNELFLWKDKREVEEVDKEDQLGGAEQESAHADELV